MSTKVENELKFYQEKYKDAEPTWQWYEICRNEDLSIECIETYADQYAYTERSWMAISQYQAFNKILPRFVEKVDWCTIFTRKDITEELFTTYLDHATARMLAHIIASSKTNHPLLSAKFIKKVLVPARKQKEIEEKEQEEQQEKERQRKKELDIMVRESVADLNTNTDVSDETTCDWGKISTNKILSEDFIRRFADKVDWNKISAYQTLSEPFLKEFQDKIDWTAVSAAQRLSKEFVTEFADKVSWKNIMQFQNFDFDFLFANRERCYDQFKSCVSDHIKDDEVKAWCNTKELFRDLLNHLNKSKFSQSCCGCCQ